MSTADVVLVTGLAFADDERERLRAIAPGLDLRFGDAAGYDGVAAVAGRVPDDALAGLRWNHLWSAGVDGALTPAMRASDVVLTASLGNGGIPLAEHALLFLLMLDRGGLRWADAQRAHRWDHFPHGELHGRTLGLVGLGTAGAHLAGIARAMGMRVLGVSRSGRPVEGVDIVPLDALLRESDAVVVTAPSTDETRGMLGAAEFALMKPTAVYVNVSRGDVADRDALLAALRDGTIAGAGLDAHAVEPLPADAPEWDLPNVIVTPHNGSTSGESRERAVAVFAENLRRFAAGEDLVAVVDKAAGY